MKSFTDNYLREFPTFVARCSAVFAYLMIPGAILIKGSRPILAFCYLPILYIFLVLLSLANSLTRPSILIAVLMSVIVFHIFTLIYFGIGGEKKTYGRRYQSALLYLFGLALFDSGFITAGYLYKSEALGFELFYIPTDSMSPNIQPGDIAIVDTWIDTADLMQGDVIVFRHPYIDRMNLVKRISILHPDASLSVLGDNKRNSLDSRLLGKIDGDLIIGRVNTILRSWKFIEL